MTSTRSTTPTSPTTPTPREITATLADGREVTLGPLSWPGYKQTKNRVLEVLKTMPLLDELIADGVELAKTAFASGQLGNPTTDPATSPGSQWSDRAGALGEKVARQLPRLVDALESAIDSATPELVRGCLRTAVDESSLSAVDWLRLRQAAMEVCQLTELLDLEKNWRASAIGSLLRMVNSAGKNPSSALPLGG